MKRLFLFGFLFGLSLLASVCAAERLPQTVVPDSYQLIFAPDFATNESRRDACHWEGDMLPIRKTVDQNNRCKSEIIA